jgi:hypothetical protein
LPAISCLFAKSFRTALRKPKDGWQLYGSEEGEEKESMPSLYQPWCRADPYDARIRNLMKARKSPRWHPPRPWRSRQETDAIKRLVWRWYTHTGPGTTRESGRVVARHLGVSHTYIQKLCRQFAIDPSQMQERDRYEGRAVEAMLKELAYGLQCTQDMRERGELRFVRGA